MLFFLPKASRNLDFNTKVLLLEIYYLKLGRKGLRKSHYVSLIDIPLVQLVSIYYGGQILCAVYIVIL